MGFMCSSVSHRPIHRLLICQDSGERSGALGPLVCTCVLASKTPLLQEKLIRQI